MAEANITIDELWMTASPSVQKEFVSRNADQLKRLLQTTEREVKDARISDLVKVQHLCVAAGCNCKIIETEKGGWLSASEYARHSSYIIALGNGGYQIKFGRNGQGVEEYCVNAEKAAAALIWESRNKGKRWMKNRGYSITGEELEAKFPIRACEANYGHWAKED